MNLSEGEQILKVYRHHPTPFVYDLLKVIIGAFPFFFLSFLFQPVLSPGNFIILNISIFCLFVFIIIYVSLIYWLDKLVVTNKRIVFVNWKYLTMRNESEAMLDDFQDIRTEEKGFLSNFKMFDYGMLRLDTASSFTIIEFPDAPDPEGMRMFIYHLKNHVEDTDL